jgi:aryl-alcohol dehydrogenase-like predicted oxidoreductase
MSEANRIGHRIGLGTVQFGVDYGVTNAGGMTPQDDVRVILSLAAENGIDLLDTAHLYGQSENVLGQTLPPDHAFQIVTKTPDFSRLELRQTGDAARALKDAFQESLQKLHASSIYGLMVHNAGGMNGPYAREIYDTLLGLKQDGKVAKIGLSVYSADDLHQVVEHCGPIDLVQVPVNLFDQRLMMSGALKEIKARGIEIHARSLFLQGVLLADHVPDSLSAFSGSFTRYRDFLHEHEISALAACLNFAFSVTDIDRWIIGVNTPDHLREIIDIANKIEGQKFDFSSLSSDNEMLINPARWPKS